MGIASMASLVLVLVLYLYITHHIPLFSSLLLSSYESDWIWNGTCVRACMLCFAFIMGTDEEGCRIALPC